MIIFIILFDFHYNHKHNYQSNLPVLLIAP
ncbi:hypothetical protein IX307_001967 [Bacteroides pyogenes]|nr:hypothetical protein [Bacteroides pyogenes]MBR8720823.1 hypothetical protein [Bacteroides pyogenes]MBR8724290.1 hypothetical protein [Bacteroides pyogenes]MBR8737473.1 hypothetical protein [Bacteroides pyogenes]MBR8753516.1 hypothetical protein [Bacteroides pyogenes]